MAGEYGPVLVQGVMPPKSTLCCILQTALTDLLHLRTNVPACSLQYEIRQSIREMTACAMEGMVPLLPILTIPILERQGGEDFTDGWFKSKKFLPQDGGSQYGSDIVSSN